MSAAHVWLVHVAPPDPDFVGYGTGPEGVRSQVAVEHHERHLKVQDLAERLRSKGVVRSSQVPVLLVPPPR